jgi:hypothetical protein
MDGHVLDATSPTRSQQALPCFASPTAQGHIETIETIKTIETVFLR